MPAVASSRGSHTEALPAEGRPGPSIMNSSKDEKSTSADFVIFLSLSTSISRLLVLIYSTPGKRPKQACLSLCILDLQPFPRGALWEIGDPIRLHGLKIILF